MCVFGHNFLRRELGHGQCFGKHARKGGTTTLFLLLTKLNGIILFLRFILHSHRGVLSEEPPDPPSAAVIVLRLCKLLALGVDEPEGGAGDSRLSDDFDGFIDRFRGASSCGSLTAAATAAAAAAANEDAIDDEDFALRFKPAHSLICSDMESLPVKISIIRRQPPRNTGTQTFSSIVHPIGRDGRWQLDDFYSIVIATTSGRTATAGAHSTQPG